MSESATETSTQTLPAEPPKAALSFATEDDARRWAEANVASGLKAKNTELLGKLSEHATETEKSKGLAEELDRIKRAISGESDNIPDEVKPHLEAYTKKQRERFDAEKNELLKRAEQSEQFGQQLLAEKHESLVGKYADGVIGKIAQDSDKARDIIRSLANQHFEVEIDEATGNEKVQAKNPAFGEAEFKRMLMEDYSFLLNETRGSGARGYTGKSGKLKRGDMTAKQKADFIGEYGEDEYFKIPA